MCSEAARRAARRDRHGRVRWLPSQRPGLAAAAGLSAAEVAAAAWAVTAGGARRRGAAAVALALDAACLGERGMAQAAYRLPGLRGALDAAYALFARHRGRFGGAAACAARRPAPLDAATRAELARRAARGGWAPLDAEDMGDGADRAPDPGAPSGRRP